MWPRAVLTISWPWMITAWILIPEIRASNMSTVSYADSHSPSTKVYAIVFPQFHSDPLNDKLWGVNYTDWERLKKTPKFNKLGQHIVRPSSDYLGYYNLLDYETRKRSRLLAQEYGIDGFLYYHYWWNQVDPKVTLHGPLEKMLVDGEPDLPFAFTWVRAPWSSTWQGQGNDTKYTGNQILVDIKCPPISDPLVDEHYTFLRRFFHHKNYIKVHGAPLFVLLDWKVTKDCDDIIAHLKKLAVKDGFPSPGLHVVRIRTLLRSELYPNAKKAPSIDSDRGADAAMLYPYSDLPANVPITVPEYCFAGQKTPWKKTLYPCIMAAFDNTPRRKFQAASIYKRNYTRHGPIRDFAYDMIQMIMYERCCQDPAARGAGGNFMAINAWNEWGEGNVLEPSDITGYMYLKAVVKARAIADRIGCDWNDLRSYNDRYFRNLVSVNG